MCRSICNQLFTLPGLPTNKSRATLKAGMMERRNDGMAESRNGGKLPQILKDGIAESRNHGMAENTPKS